MLQTRLVVVSLVTLALASAHGTADEVRYLRENGVDYREVRSVVPVPKSELRYEERPRTVYREQIDTNYVDQQRTVVVPITEYRWEAEWRGRWNPFSQPYLVQKLVPRTRYEYRTETVRVPVTQRRMIPVQQVERTPILYRWLAQEETVSRVAVQPAAGQPAIAQSMPSGAPGGSTAATSLAQPSSIGGIRRLENDPPRFGSALGHNSSMIRRY